MNSSTLRSIRFQSVIRIFPVFLSVFLLSLSAFANSHARIVRLSYVDGNVEIDNGDGRGFSPAYMNMPITSQSKLWARDGEAEVEFEDGSTARLTPDTIINFQQLDSGNNGDRLSTLVLQDGTAYFDIHHRDGDEFDVQFGAQTLQLTHSAHFRIDADNAGTELAVLSGEVQVSARGEAEVAVKKGETMSVDAEDPDRYQLAKGIDEETYDQWDLQRAEDHQREVAAAAAVGNNSDVNYGFSDLNAYGNYFFVPGYGYMWRPNSVPLGWDPFADGYWVDYPGYGYMFVSGYPWGWAPYRYGSWQFVNGYGWCWNPGNNFATWQALPPLRNIPPHYRPPRPPRPGTGVVVVQNGTVAPLPARRAIIHEDNDSLARGFVRSKKIVAGDGRVVQQPAAPTGAPAQSLVGNQSAPASAAASAPASAPGAVPPVAVQTRPIGIRPVEGRPAIETLGPGARRSTGAERPDRGVVVRPVTVESVVAPAASPKPSPAVAPAPARTVAPMPVHSVAPAPARMAPAPRMAPSAPHMETHSTPAAPAMHMSMPAPAHASAPSGGGASHGSHR